MFDAFKRSGKPGGNDWPRLVVLSIILSLRAYNADYDDDDDIHPLNVQLVSCSEKCIWREYSITFYRLHMFLIFRHRSINSSN